MKKILLILRVSTDAQDLEEQKKEMIEFALSEGYSLDNIICLEGKGASAIKIDDRYIELFNDVKTYVESSDIECVAVWHLNRLARDEEWFIKYKKLLSKNKIQLIVKNPSLKLLNPDGSINSGMELAFSLFSTMAKQDMEEKKAKFKRTKKANAAKGKYNGGDNIRFGYKVENDYFVIDEEQGKIVSTIFELYSTGEYSAESLAKEICSRGVDINKQQIMRILESDAYCGTPQVKYNNRVYPAIISLDLYNRCKAIREDNKLNIRRGDNICLGAKLIKCSVCGGTFSSNGKCYACCRHSVLKACDNSITIKKNVIDDILWMASSMLHVKYMVQEGEDNLKNFQSQIEIYDQKINTLVQKLNKIQEKKDRVYELYIEGAINSENKALRLNKIDEEGRTMADELNSLKEAKNRLLGLIEDIKNKDKFKMVTEALDGMIIDKEKLEYKYNIIHKYITHVLCYREWFGEERDLRAKKENGIRIDIHTIDGNITTYMYVPNGYKGQKIWVLQ